MKNIDVIRELITSMRDLEPKNEALRIGIVAILDRLSQCNTKKAEVKAEAETEAEPKKRGRPGRGRKPFDIGKAEACKNAGWSIAQIADELGVTEQTVRNNFNKAGIKYGATITE